MSPFGDEGRGAFTKGVKPLGSGGGVGGTGVGVRE